MDNIRLLIVEDDPNLGQILKEFLEIKGYSTVLARDGEEGLKQFCLSKFNICLLDIMMPKKDGFTLAKEIRERNQSIPFIFLTAKNMKEDTITGLKLGADDYITKPFSMEELVLRIQNILKRTDVGRLKSEDSPVKIAGYTFRPDLRILNGPKGETRLTTKEAQLLKLLASHLNQVVDRNYALLSIWGDDSYFNARSMDVYIAKLRKHLRDDETVQLITEHGIGFRLTCP